MKPSILKKTDIYSLKGAPGLLSVREDLPHCHAHRPNIGLMGEVTLTQGFRRTPKIGFFKSYREKLEDPQKAEIYETRKAQYGVVSSRDNKRQQF